MIAYSWGTLNPCHVSYLVWGRLSPHVWTMLQTGTQNSRTGKSRASQVFSACEFCIIFAGIPLLIATLRRPGLLVIVLWGGGLIAWLTTRRHALARKPVRYRPILLRFLVLAPVLTLIVWRAMPAHFLDLPRHKPVLWAAIMVLYPALSVWPQEIIYRRFIFQRFGDLFRTQPLLIAASAAAFGLGHIIFLNAWAVLLTLAGGVLFAQTYARSGSVRAASIEHSLYGCLVFTIGLGRFFYTGSAWH
jgi:membrane protease YdiL (CAAX protease family)